MPTRGLLHVRHVSKDYKEPVKKQQTEVHLQSRMRTIHSPAD